MACLSSSFPPVHRTLRRRLSLTVKLWHAMRRLGWSNIRARPEPWFISRRRARLRARSPWSSGNTALAEPILNAERQAETRSTLRTVTCDKHLYFPDLRQEDRPPIAKLWRLYHLGLIVAKRPGDVVKEWNWSDWCHRSVLPMCDLRSCPSRRSDGRCVPNRVRDGDACSTMIVATPLASVVRRGVKRQDRFSRGARPRLYLIRRRRVADAQ